jgi:hypothetical protein
MANCIMHTYVQAMSRPRALQTQLLASARNAYASYALPCILLSDTFNFFDTNRTPMSVGIIGVAQGSSVPISRGGPPI